ncbi:putative eSX-5 secretion system protein EccE5 [Mycobacterium xenopi 4042]|uniref:Putative eSX-5 secretion system protein EccE5 n=1 Tax=Mycobacterium xenopi 4042 TaxID=1299334 RepID=X8BGS0_MYCXE|nr:putative eSX-5 secretion system protein EccE5 [Mycobacterium xenopi 4042]
MIDVAVLALVSHLPDAWQANHIAWWTGVGVAVLVTIVAVVTYRRTPLASALVARVLDRFVDPEMTLTEGCTPALDHQRRFGHDVVGIREYQGQLVAVVTVEGHEEAPSGRHRNRDAAPAWLPVEAVAARLRQFDVRLDAIDIVSVGTRRTSGRDDVSDVGVDDTGRWMLASRWTSITPGWCCAWIRSATLPRWRRVIRWPPPWRPPPSGWPMTSTVGAGRRDP